jgi:hypothetical protein
MKLIYYFIGLLIFIGTSVAQTPATVEITSIPLGEVKMAGFTLKTDKSVNIEAVGAGEKTKVPEELSYMVDPNGLFAYAWIINAKSRDLVWRMDLKNTSRFKKSEYSRIFKGSVNLPRGEYELYYSARIPDFAFFDDGFFSLGRLFDKLFKNDKWYENTQHDWYVRIGSVDEVVDRNSIVKYHKVLKEQAVVSMTGLQNSEFKQEGFKLTEKGTFEIYAIGETFDKEVFDYGWIVNANTSEKIWETLADKGKYAGGAKKNREWRETLTLEPGTYWVYFAMDGSHSPNNWNSNPPYDPDFYGITMRGVPGKFNPKSIERIIKQKIQPIVDLTRLGNNESVQEGFKLIAPMQIRIYALGEGRRGEMFDYGWIVDLTTGERIWEMTYNRTRYAGGADKNRMTDEIITLAAGSYMVHFVTDASHSYSKWNSDKPNNPENWGITIYPADPKFNRENIQKLEAASMSENIVAQIIRVSNGRLYQERFKLSKKTPLRIYAIGEGDWDEMYDYGWIENAETGAKVWEMDYDQTRWAGGARKNRKIDDNISLPAGNYILFYNTDDSHTFNNWNDDPPDDPYFYGITVYRVER